MTMRDGSKVSSPKVDPEHYDGKKEHTHGRLLANERGTRAITFALAMSATKTGFSIILHTKRTVNTDPPKVQHN